MILFDYGRTLLYEPNWNSTKGLAELLKYATKNPNHCTLEDVERGAEVIFGKHMENIRRMGYDVSGQVGNKVLYAHLGIEFSLTPLEMEIIYLTAACIGAVMPDADKMLDYISSNGIRSAVISNLKWSGDALTERLNRLLPNHRFEFVMTSSDYLVQKPNRILFDIALQKADISADEAWYCGDDPQADIEGAAQVGIYPIWYDNDTGKEDRAYLNMQVPRCSYLHIHEWSEMIHLLERLKP